MGSEDRFFRHQANTIFFIYGFVTLLAQIVLLRELAILFQGSEFFLGFSLAAWLTWTGAGSWMGQKMPSKFFPALFFFLGLLVPLEMMLIRILRPFLGLGLMPGPVLMMSLTAVLFSPFCLISGMVFSTGIGYSKDTEAIPVSRIYFLETCGAVVGGLVYTLVFAGRMPNGMMAAALAWTTFVFSLGLPFSRFLKGAGFVFLFLLSFSAWDRLSRQFEWKGWSLIESTDSRYATYTLTRTKEQKQLWVDGKISAVFPDVRAEEHFVHWPMLASSEPKRVLLIGNPSVQNIRETLKHPVTRIDRVTMDPVPDVLVLLDQDRETFQMFLDSRLNRIQQDPRDYLSKSNVSYDGVLVDTPAPSSASENRFYTQEFFKQIRAHLSPSGILAFQVPGAENYFPPATAFMAQSVLRTLKSVFPYTAVVPGGTLVCLASREKIELDARVLASRYQERKMQNLEVVPSNFPVFLDPRRQEFVDGALSKYPDAALNRDFRPMTYFYLLKSWLYKYKSPVHFLWLVCGVLGLLIGIRKLWQMSRVGSGAGEVSSLFLLGFSGMVFEVVILTAFQARRGYLFSEIGILFALFMAGMALGAWWGSRESVTVTKSDSHRCLRFQALYGILLAGSLFFSERISFLSSTWVFYGLILIAGFIPGMAFSVFSREAEPACLYASDLWGSALGALLAGLILMPLVGLTGAVLGTVGLLILGTVLR